MVKLLLTIAERAYDLLVGLSAGAVEADGVLAKAFVMGTADLLCVEL